MSNDGPLRSDMGTYGAIAADEVFTAIRDRFDELSEASGLTQAAVAKRMGVSSQLVSRWLSGPTNISAETLGKIAAALESNLCVSLQGWEQIARGNRAHSLDAFMAKPRPNIQRQGGASNRVDFVFESVVSKAQTLTRASAPVPQAAVKITEAQW